MLVRQVGPVNPPQRPSPGSSVARRALLEVQYTVYGTLQVLIERVVRRRAAAGKTRVVHVWRVRFTAFGRK